MIGVQTLAAVASSQPQAAYAALTKSLQSEWNFTMGVNVGQCVDEQFITLFIFCFSSILFGVEVNVTERELFGLPKYGGLGIINPVAIADHCFDYTFYFVKSILGMTSFELDEHIVCVQSAKSR